MLLAGERCACGAPNPKAYRQTPGAPRTWAASRQQLDQRVCGRGGRALAKGLSRRYALIVAEVLGGLRGGGEAEPDSQPVDLRPHLGSGDGEAVVPSHSTLPSLCLLWQGRLLHLELTLLAPAHPCAPPRPWSRHPGGTW